MYKSIYEYKDYPRLNFPDEHKIYIGNIKGEDIYWYATGEKLEKLIDMKRKDIEMNNYEFKMLQEQQLYKKLIILL